MSAWLTSNPVRLLGIALSVSVFCASPGKTVAQSIRDKFNQSSRAYTPPPYRPPPSRPPAPVYTPRPQLKPAEPRSINVPRPGPSGLGNSKTAVPPNQSAKPLATTFGSRASLNPSQQSRIQAKLKTLFNKQALRGRLPTSFKNASRPSSSPVSKMPTTHFNSRPPSTKLTPKFNLGAAATERLRLRLASVRQKLASAKLANNARTNVITDADDKFSRTPKSVMDEMVLDAAKQGKGQRIIEKLNDPKFYGMEKWSYGETSANGLRSEVHYVRDPKTGELMDFKFAQHAETAK
jgi:hypothetical protein